MWNSSMPCFSPDGQRIAWSADNWTNVGWPQKLNPTEPPFEPSFWKPLFGQGSSHQIWTCELSHINDGTYYFPPSYWGWKDGNSEPGGGSWNGGHQHHKHYNPSWDEQP